MTNRLARETSPYLLQHAHNAVDWYPWGDEALQRARTEDRPILLSIGYSACHWCHVMERESFEDDETAALMNRWFVNIKVDREERPDLDSIYMRAVQAMTGQGGWPLTAFLVPDGRPFYGGTYFPPEPRHGMPSFRQVLSGAANAYATRRDEVLRAGDRLKSALDRRSIEPLAGIGRKTGTGQGEGPDAGLVARSVALAGRTFDPARGGFGAAPKFPQAGFLDFLLRTGDARAPGPSMAIQTLTCMAAGGIRDHAGGGFHRYSVDARWLVPHFEKMLYDNALIARALTRAHLLGATHLGPVAAETLDYILEDLTSPDGVFYSARDADSEDDEGTSVEGAFYLWTPAQVAALLDRDAARLLCRVYDVSESGNFEGRNILHLPHDLDAVARQEGTSAGELWRALQASLTVLKAGRGKRPAPMRDEKVLTCWNGLAIQALAEAGPALSREEYTRAAARAADCLLNTVRRPDGDLYRVWAGGQVRVDGFLEDYGALGCACLSLYEATLEPRWLEAAGSIADRLVERFWSPSTAVFYDAARGGETLLVRPRDITDSAAPSGNSLALDLLGRLAAVTASAKHRSIVQQVLEREQGTAEHYPLAAAGLLVAVLGSATPRLEVTLVGAGAPTRAMLAVAHQHVHANRVIAGGDPGHPTVRALPAMEGRLGRADSAGGQAQVCLGNACQEPVTTVTGLAEALKQAGAVSLLG